MPTGLELRYSVLLNGLETAVPSTVKAIAVNGKALTPAQVIALVASTLKVFSAVRETRALLRQLALDRSKNMPAARELFADVKAGLQAGLGRSNEALRSFGIAPTKPRRKLTTEERAHAAALAKATRELRGTKGSRQKAALKATEVPPEESPPSPATPPVKPEAHGGNVAA